MAAKKNTNVQQQSRRDFALQISSYKDDDTPVFPGPWSNADVDRGDTYGNHFVWGASSVNTDFALAAECEAGDDLSAGDDQEWTDLLLSPMFWKLRETFVEEAESGSRLAFMHAIWRSYNAGRLSDDRLEPRTEEERQASRLKTARMMREAEAKGEARRAAEGNATS